MNERDELLRQWQRVKDHGFMPHDALLQLLARTFLYLLKKGTTQ